MEDSQHALLILKYGNDMTKNKDNESDIEIPGEDDENVGDGSPVKKREKRRKSKEERIAERKVVFWTLLIILVITFGFWLLPKIQGLMSGIPLNLQMENKKEEQPNVKKTDNKNYMEITL